MAASNASSSADQPTRRGKHRPSRHPRSAHHDEPLDATEEFAGAEATDTSMVRPVRRPDPAEPEAVMCTAAIAPRQLRPPFHSRRGLATVRPREVARIGEARLLCDGMHDGPHQWPPAFEHISAGVDPETDDNSAGDGVDEGEVIVD